MLLLTLALLLSFARSTGQEPPPLRVNVTLVQVDAVVTGHEGHQVTDLTQDDFDIFEDGKPRKIRHFSYISTGTTANARRTVEPSRPTPAGLQRENVRRTVALVVDDLKMSFASTDTARQALRRFVDEQMLPGDLVSIVSTSGGASALQQFTDDKRMLHAAIGRLRFRLGAGAAASRVPDLRADSDTSDGDSGVMAQLLQRRFAVGTFGTLRYVIDGMRDMPGRKSVVLLSDGAPRMYRNIRNEEPVIAVEDVRRVSDGANRSAVVIYSIDTRGLVYPGLQAADDVQGLQPDEVQEKLDARGVKFRDGQQALSFLAMETGGLTYFDRNDINAGLARMLEQQSGYYLLSFQPGEEDAERMKREGKYHRLMVKVKRPGLRVRYRTGYVGGRTDEDQPRTPAQRLMAALNSPFMGTDIHLRLTPVFAAGDKGQLAIQALVHIDGAGLTFEPPDSNGMQSAKLHLVATTLGETAIPEGITERTYVVRVKPEEAARIQSEGLVYALEHVVKRPGAYHLRVAVMDDSTGRLGSAARFTEIPDLSKPAAALSGIWMGDGDWRPALHGAAKSMDRDLSAAIRVFRRDHPFSYAVMLYNARIDAKTGLPGVYIQPRLIRDGDVVWTGQRIEAIPQPGMNARRILTGGVLSLGPKTSPGEYVLELQAIDTAGGRAVAAQWTEFELR